MCPSLAVCSGGSLVSGAADGAHVSATGSCSAGTCTCALNALTSLLAKPGYDSRTVAASFDAPTPLTFTAVPDPTPSTATPTLNGGPVPPLAYVSGPFAYGFELSGPDTTAWADSSEGGSGTPDTFDGQGGLRTFAALAAHALETVLELRLVHLGPCALGKLLHGTWLLHELKQWLRRLRVCSDLHAVLPQPPSAGRVRARTART